MSTRGGNGDGTRFSTIWASIISTIIALVAVVGGFWSLADPRADIKDIRQSFLTLREHAEFVSRFDRDLLRIESDHRRFQEDLIQLRRETMTKPDFAAFQHERDNQRAQTQKQLETLEEMLHNHIEQDTNRFTTKPSERPK